MKRSDSIMENMIIKKAIYYYKASSKEGFLASSQNISNYQRVWARVALYVV
jgi:hypothetical protein